MTHRQSACIAAALVLAVAATPATAQEPFAAIPVDDAALAEVRGTFLPASLAMSARQFGAIQDAEARADFRFTGTIGTVMIDVWWSDPGADLIAAAAH